MSGFSFGPLTPKRPLNDSSVFREGQRSWCRVWSTGLDLLVKVELGVLGKDAGGCAVAARTRLPPGIYVDPYELASLQRHNLTKKNSFSF
uniref:Phosphatidylinositol-glycan biosynthesis class X protein n=1 Tax=Athene cunicularia TaxID=194338 RepID=A0A663LUM3_ATHCN